MNNIELKQQILSVVNMAMQQSFNRALSALEDAKAIDTKKMREHYNGFGSKYYDLVTEQMKFTEQQLEPIIDEIIQSSQGNR